MKHHVTWLCILSEKWRKSAKFHISKELPDWPTKPGKKGGRAEMAVKMLDRWITAQGSYKCGSWRDPRSFLFPVPHSVLTQTDLSATWGPWQ